MTVDSTANGIGDPSTSSITVAPMPPGDPMWSELSRTGIGRTSYHCPDLVASASAANGLRSTGWAAWRNDEMVGGLVLQIPPVGHPGPLPSVAFNGPVVRTSPSGSRSSRDRHNSRVVSALLDRVADTQRASTIRVHPDVGDIRVALNAGWSARPTFTYEMDISSLDGAWGAMDRNRRRLIRRAEQHGYRVEALRSLGNAPDSMIEHLIRLQMLQLGTYGPAAQPDAAVWRHLIGSLLESGNGRLLVASTQSGLPVAFQCTVLWGDRAGNMFTGSDPSHADAGANSLLRWKAAEILHGLGARRVDLNGARPGIAGRFKASLGATVTERWDLWRPDGHPPPPPVRRIARRIRREAGRLRADVRRRTTP